MNGRIAKAAELLVHARKHGERLPDLPGDVCPRTVEEAYRIQRAVEHSRGQPRAGFKLGLTNAAAQQALGADEPIIGVLGAQDVRESGTRIALPANHLRIVEAEVVFEMATDLPAAKAPYSLSQVRASVQRARAGIELCNARLDELDPPSVPCLIADDCNADCIVLGDELTEVDLESLHCLPVTLQVGAGPSVVGTTANVLGNPLNALAWCANWLARQGEALTRGQLVSTGSCTGMTEVDFGAEVQVTIGARARVRAEFVRR